MEIGELRKELQEKQDLLCQAAKAMELMEESQRKAHNKSSLTITDLSQKIKYLEVRSLDRIKLSIGILAENLIEKITNLG